MKHANIILSCMWLLASAMTHSGNADLVHEDCSGTGPFSAIGGPTGFDANGWTAVGVPGSFSTNGLGETVYNQTSTSTLMGVSQDGLVRTIGNADFDSVLRQLRRYPNPPHSWWFRLPFHFWQIVGSGDCDHDASGDDAKPECCPVAPVPVGCG